MAAMAEIKKEVTEFIVDNFLFGSAGDAPQPEDSFMDTGLVDSTGILEVVAFVESKYEISVEDDELIPENLDSVTNLVQFITRKRGK